MSLDTLFIVEAENEEHAYEIAYNSIPKSDPLNLVIVENVTDDDSFKDWKENK